MRTNFALPLLTALALAFAACEADDEALPEGATLEEPPAMEDAPVVDEVGPERLGEGQEIVPTDTLQEVRIDTAQP